MEGDQQIEQVLNKFSDSLVLSTAALSDEIQVWDPKNLAPSDSFYVYNST